MKRIMNQPVCGCFGEMSLSFFSFFIGLLVNLIITLGVALCGAAL